GCGTSASYRTACSMRAGGGEITLRTELIDGGRLVCTIQDKGPGVPAGQARPGGFGLLSVRRRLALRYADAASFRVESSPAGTRCIVELPLEEGSGSRAMRPAQALVLEDEGPARNYLVRLIDGTVRAE